jgi:hypothetical protein
MKGIYLTAEARQEIEAKIEEIDLYIQDNKNKGYYALESYHNGRKMVYNEILSYATILPVYESLGQAMQNKDLDNPQGVIIQPKQ